MLVSTGFTVAMAVSAFAQGHVPDVETATVPAPADSNVFVFGGVFSSESVGETLNIFGTDYQDAYLLGAGYQKFLVGHEGSLRLGAELGLALRKGSDPSAEAWAGLVLRADGILQTKDIRLSASVTGGFSLITQPLDVEIAREIDRGGGDSQLLFYMAPELSLSTASNPNMELFYRLQHRSGGWETLGGMGEGANANTVGVRWSF